MLLQLPPYLIKSAANSGGTTYSTLFRVNNFETSGLIILLSVKSA